MDAICIFFLRTLRISAFLILKRILQTVFFSWQYIVYDITTETLTSVMAMVGSLVALP